MKALRPLGPAVCVLAAAYALAACGGGSSTKTAARAASSSSSTTTSAPAPTVAAATNPKLGQLLVDAKGMTLYHNVKEHDAAIVCTGSCTSTWPPLLLAPGGAPTTAAGIPGTVAAVTRPDGSTQVTYNGEPLYHFAGDNKPGDVNGQGVAGVWFAVSPAATAATTQPPTTVAATRAPAQAPTTRRPAPTPTMAHTAPPPTPPPATMAPATTPPKTMPPVTSCAYPPCY